MKTKGFCDYVYVYFYNNKINMLKNQYQNLFILHTHVKLKSVMFCCNLVKAMYFYTKDDKTLINT